MTAVKNYQVRVVSSTYYHEIAANRMLGHRSRRVIGYNGDIGGTLTDLSELGVPIIPLPTEPIELEVVSTSDEDKADPPGAGAWTVTFYGLDENWDEAISHKPLNGTTPVPLDGMWWRSNNFDVTTLPSLGVAVGDILIRGIDNGIVYNKIPAGGNVNLQCHCTIPNKKQGFIVAWHPGILTSKEKAQARVFLRATVSWSARELTSGVYHFQDLAILNDAPEHIPFAIPLLVPAKCDIKVSAQQVTGTGNVQAGVAVELFYEDI